jgi:hypothetical protein
MPDPVALSSAEAECMATELPVAADKKSKKSIQDFIDNRNAVDMGNLIRKT